jgi:hypothetical protein
MNLIEFSAVLTSILVLATFLLEAFRMLNPRPLTPLFRTAVPRGRRVPVRRSRNFIRVPPAQTEALTSSCILVAQADV